MLLWLRNLRQRGSDLVFFISGQISAQYDAVVSVQAESVITVQYEAVVSVQAESVITVQYEETVSIQSDDTVSI